MPKISVFQPCSIKFIYCAFRAICSFRRVAFEDLRFEIRVIELIFRVDDCSSSSSAFILAANWRGWDTLS